MVESYIVHIYRRDEAVPTKILGTVEKVGKRDKSSFENLNELWAILASAKGERSGGERGPGENSGNPAPTTL